MDKILCIAVHPDDETLGCGGTLFCHKKNGDQINWLILTTMQLAQGWSGEAINTRRKEIEKVSKGYGFKKVDQLDFPTARLDAIPLSDLVAKIAEVIRQLKPTIIYIPNRSDIHTDHQVSFKAIMSCTKTFRFPSIKRVLMYETISETEFAPPLPETTFTPNVFIDISPFVNKKIQVMKIYKSEIKPFPFPRSEENIRALATFRGATAGVRSAEAFMLIKEVI